MDRLNRSHSLSAEQGCINESAGKTVQIDPAASLALAEAVRSARQGLKPLPIAEANGQVGSKATVAGKISRLPLAAHAAIALLLIGAGSLASYAGTLANREAFHRMEAETARSQEILAKLTDDLAALKSTMASFKDVEQTSSTNVVSDQAKIAEKVERLSVALQDPAKKLSGLEDRLERMESQITAALNASKPSAPAPAPASVNDPDGAPVPKPVKTEPVDGWVLREVYNGSAVVESRKRGLYEVIPGNIIPGVGRVEAIERRGARWVVVTDKGFIGTYR